MINVLAFVRPNCGSSTIELRFPIDGALVSSGSNNPIKNHVLSKKQSAAMKFENHDLSKLFTKVWI
jgi:hypothetical protein